MFAQNRVPPWLFGITSLPFGIGVAFATMVMPNIMRKAGIEVENIGWYTVAVMLPSFTQFLYAPLVDSGFRKKTWLIYSALLAAVCFGLAIQMPLPDKKNLFLLFTVVGQFLLSLVSAANGGLMATVFEDGQRGKAAGWYNTGNLSGGALGAGLFLWLLNKGTFSSIQLSGIVASLVAFPALIAIMIPENNMAHRVSALAIFQNTLRDVWKVLSSHAGWTGVLFCLSPVSTVALTNCFSALSPDYHVSKKWEVITLGPLIGLVSAVGSLLGGFLCDRFNRRYLYLFSGVLTVAANLLCALLPLTQPVYVFAVTLYLLIAGLAYAAASAVVLELIGKAGRSAGTQYSLFVAAGNFAITYVGWIDTRFHKAKGPTSLFIVDACLNAVGIVVLILMTVFLARRKKEKTM